MRRGPFPIKIKSPSFFTLDHKIFGLASLILSMFADTLSDRDIPPFFSVHLNLSLTDVSK